MGNRGLTRSLGLSNRNKEFQSIAPSPLNETTQEEKIENARKRKVAEVGRIDDNEVKNVKFPVTTQSLPVDFKETEGKLRRDNLANFETECSQISKFIFVSGMKVAADYDLLVQKGIKRIVNCAPMVSPNFHDDRDTFKYLSINLVDGRVEDVSWFVCQVIHFVKEGVLRGERVLIHCEKGVSRSCSMAIAHRMWYTGESWKVSFDFVKTQRRICSPNTAFTVNLIELTELFSGDASRATLLFRLAYHAAYDPDTPVLKLCRNEGNRRILVPATSLLNPKAVFVIRAVRLSQAPGQGENSANADLTSSSIIDKSNNISVSFQHFLYVWMGKESTSEARTAAVQLSRLMIEVLSQAKDVCIVNDGEEGPEFLSYLAANGPFQPHDNNGGVGIYHDYFGACRPSDQELQEAAAVRFAASNITQEFLQTLKTPVSLGRQGSSNSLNSETIPATSATVSRNNSNTKLSLGNLNYQSVNINGGFTSSDEQAVNYTSNRSRLNNNADMAISIPAALSRVNSFSSIDSDGQPSLSREERLSRIHNIIDSAVQNSTNSTSASNTLSLALPHSAGTSRTKRRTSSKRHRSDDGSSVSDNDADGNSSSGLESPIVFNRNKQTETRADLRAESESSSSFDSNDPIADRSVRNTAEEDAPSFTSKPPAFSLSIPTLQTSSANSKIEIDKPMSHSSSKNRFVPAIGLYPLTEAQNSASNSAVNTSRPQSAAPSTNSTRNTGIQLSLNEMSNNNNVNHTKNNNSNNNANVCLNLTTPSLSNGNSSSRSCLPGLSLHIPSSNTGTGVPSLNIPKLTAATNITETSTAAPLDSNTAAPPSKPLLFQASSIEDEDLVDTHWIAQWSAMGVYDDEDLEDGNTLLLLCPSQTHYLWIGADSSLSSALSDVPKSHIGRWLQRHVVAGETQSWKINWETDRFIVESPGEESESFWEMFNEGF